MIKRWDILGIGSATVDDFLYVNSFPNPDTKMQIVHRERRVGGLTANALIAAARLGADCAYAGVLGHDELSRFVEQALDQEGVDTSHVVRRDDAKPIHATVIVGQTDQTRTILYEVEGRVGADDELPTTDTIRAARVLLLDMYGMDGNIRAAAIAREAEIPVVADFEHSDVPQLEQLLPLIDHLIVTSDFAQNLTESSQPDEAAQKLWTAGRAVVVVTEGANGCWYVSADQMDRVEHQPAFPVDVIDTTGCGDVFHGVYALELSQGSALQERVRIASAAAALKATQRGMAALSSRQDLITILGC